MGWFRKRKATMESGGDELLQKLDGKELAYVTCREADESGTVVERVLGKQGRLNTIGGAITVACDGKVVFCCDSATAQYGELMNLSGVVITGTDRESGERRKIVAYYQYYR